MERIIVEIYLPVANMVFDVSIAASSKIGEVALLAAKALSELSEGAFLAADDTVLCDADSGEILEINKSVSELNIVTGSRLMLI